MSTGELRWAVKDSFLRYVRVIAAGTVECTGTQESPDGAFVWPLQAVVRDADALVLEFEGSVRFVAHGGFLDVDLAAPALRLGAESSELSIATPTGRVVIATVADGDGAPSGLLTPRLTAEGGALFGGVYPADTEFAPLMARVPRPGGVSEARSTT